MPIINKQYESLDESFKPIVLQILTGLESKGWAPFVAEGRRSLKEQKQKVLKGYSQTMKSYHLTGFAADIVDKKLMWNIPYTHKYWKDYSDIVQTIKLSKGHLRWGGTWNVSSRLKLFNKAYETKNEKLITWFCDPAHIELRT